MKPVYDDSLCTLSENLHLMFLSLWLSLKIDKVAITHLAMEIHFQTTDHVVAVEEVAEQHNATKYSKCNSLRVISHIITLGKSAITHSKGGQSSPIPLVQATLI